jgi:hypothetical protein
VRLQVLGEGAALGGLRGVPEAAAQVAGAGVVLRVLVIGTVGHQGLPFRDG